MPSIRVVVVTLGLGWASVTAPAHAAPILHIHDNTGRLATVDVSTGALTVIGQLGAVMTDIAFAPNGALFGLTFNGFYSINPATGAASLIGVHGIPGGNALVFRTDGTLFAAGFDSNSLFTINPTTGASTNLGSIGFPSAGDLAFNGGDLYLSSLTDQLIRVQLGPTVSGQVVGSFGFTNVFGLATGGDGVLYGVGGTQVFSVDTSTGVGTLVSDFAGLPALRPLGPANGTSFTTEAVVPEPTTASLLGLGLALLAAHRHRARTAR